jgi:hypothetical protein
MSDKEAPFLKNADIRAGKIPGWASKPETNGDPYDPNNMERTDASMVVTDGLVMLNAASMHAAKAVGVRRLVFTALMIPFWGAVAYYSPLGASLSGYLPFSSATKPMAAGAIPAGYQREEESEINVVGNSTRAKAKPVKSDGEESSVSTESAKAEGRPDHVTARMLIDKFYSTPKDGVAREYDLTFLAKMGWPKKAFPNISYQAYWFNSFSKKFADGDYKSASESIAETCKGLELKDCLPKLSEEGQFIAIANTGEDMEKYRRTATVLDDTVKPVEQLETILGDLIQKFPKDAPSYCDSGNRRYADTWGVQQAKANLGIIQTNWQDKGEIPYSKKIVKVDSVKEMIAHREKGDKDCNNINVAVLPVKSGAVQYMMSVTARTHSEQGDQIASGLYLLGELSDRNVMSLIACNNCGTVAMFNKQLADANARKILPGLNISDKKIVSLFESSGYKLEEKQKTKTTEEKGE